MYNKLINTDQVAISQKDIEEAVEKVIAGPERKSRRLNEE